MVNLIAGIINEGVEAGEFRPINAQYAGEMLLAAAKGSLEAEFADTFVRIHRTSRVQITDGEAQPLSRLPLADHSSDAFRQSGRSFPAGIAGPCRMLLDR